MWCPAWFQARERDPAECGEAPTPRGHSRGEPVHHVQRPHQPDTPHGSLLDHEQHDVHVHGLPGSEKLAYLADYLQPVASLHRNFGFAAYLRTMGIHLVEGQSRSGDNIGDVALKAPVYDWGYTGRFGDEANWATASS